MQGTTCGTPKAGQLDPNFGMQGKVFLRFENGLQIIQAGAVAIGPDDKILVAGAATNDASESMYGLARLNADGSVDAGFGNAGIVTGVFKKGHEASASSVLLLEDNGVILVGRHVENRDPRITYRALARFDEAGDLVATFGNNGVVVLDRDLVPDLHLPPTPNEKELREPPGKSGSSRDAPYGARQIAGIAGDKIFVNETFGPTAVIFKLNLQDGQLDPGFNGIGYVALAFPSVYTSLDQLALHNSQITCAGNYTTTEQNRPLLARYNEDGSLDTSLAEEGYVVVPKGSEPYESISCTDMVRQDTDGRLVCVGSSLPLGTPDVHCMILVRNADGGANPQFNHGEALFTAVGEQGAQWTGVHVDPLSRMILVGNTLGPGTDIIVGRCDESGNWDTSFGPEGWILVDIDHNIDAALGSALQPDGKLLICGLAFNEEQTGYTGFVARVQG